VWTRLNEPTERVTETEIMPVFPRKNTSYFIGYMNEYFPERSDKGQDKLLIFYRPKYNYCSFSAARHVAV